MICKHCGAEASDEHKFCPFCGKNLLEEDVSVEAVAVEPEIEKPAKKPVKTWTLVVAIIGAVLALAALGGVLLLAMGVDFLPRANDIMKKDSYTVSDEKAEKKADDVIATIGGKELTNAQLMLYYRSQTMDFISYYSSYLSSIDMDYTKPLDEQLYDAKTSWQQYFVADGLKVWHR